MRIATWDSSDPEMRWGNPNLRWGSPSYLLEPGDPGYVPPISTVTTITKTKKMKKHDLIPSTQAAYLKWHDNLKAGVTATTPGATAADVTMLTADNAALHAKSAAADTADTAAKTAHTDLATALANSKRNARALAQRIKKSTGYTPTLGTTLQLEGIEDTTDMTQEKPLLTASAKAGGVTEVTFNKKQAEGIHIYEDRAGTGTFNYLGSETHSPYVDNRPLLTAGKPETRRYKAVFFLGKAEIGLESDIVEITAHP